MAPPSTSKFSFSFSKFPEGGLILAIVVLGLLLFVLGGSVSSPKFQYNAQGKQERVFETGPDGRKVPGFESVNKFLNPQTLIQIAKDTSFFAIMAVGMTFVIITGGIDLYVRATYPIPSVCGALVLSQFGSSGRLGAGLIGSLVTVGVGILAGVLNGSMVVGFGVHPFIITLGTMAIYRGIAFVKTNGQSIGGFPEVFRSFVRQELNGLIWVPLVVMLIVMVIGGVFLSQTALGRKIYAIG